MADEVWKLGVQGLLEAYQRGATDPLEVVGCLLNRIHKINPKINAIVTLNEEAALNEAKAKKEAISKGGPLGPLHGVPILIKDNIFTKAIRTTFGSKLYQDYVPDEDAVLVERLKAAGAIVMGKTNLPEFGLIPVTDNALFGPTSNPWDLARVSGGSSGGSAAAVASFLAPAAIGNDGGGSIRIPASLCGVVGLKPQFGRVPMYPRLPGWETMAHEGPITRSVEDACLLMDVLAGPDERDRFTIQGPGFRFMDALQGGVSGMRIAYAQSLGYTVVDQEIARITKKAVFRLEEKGAAVEEVQLSLPSLETDIMAKVLSDTLAAMEGVWAKWEPVMYPLYKTFLPMGNMITALDVARIQFHREDLWEKLRRLFEGYDLLLCPTTAVSAFPRAELGPIGPETIGDEAVGPFAWIGFTYPFNFTGQPAASIPCGLTSEGLPVGLQVVGRRFDERSVLSACHCLESIFSLKASMPKGLQAGVVVK
jgi:aspartyl-tRNA(Asn)/glutamyl-tRNA(Gln) amidotransferase subunit A